MVGDRSHFFALDNNTPTEILYFPWLLFSALYVVLESVMGLAPGVVTTPVVATPHAPLYIHWGSHVAYYFLG